MRGPTGVRFQRSTQALSRHAGADVLVTTPANPDVHELAGAATAIWEELRTPLTVVDLIDRLAATHGVEPSDIATQVEGCLGTLLGFAVIEEVQDLDG